MAKMTSNFHEGTVQTLDQAVVVPVNSKGKSYRFYMPYSGKLTKTKQRTMALALLAFVIDKVPDLADNARHVDISHNSDNWMLHSLGGWKTKDISIKWREGFSSYKEDGASGIFDTKNLFVVSPEYRSKAVEGALSTRSAE